jgi:hypothetical protein
MKTAVVCGRVRWVGGKDGHEVEEYEIDTAAIEALNSIEKRAAIETGQEVDRQDISLHARSNPRADLLAKRFSLEELDAMRARMLAVLKAEERGRVIDARVPSSNSAAKDRSYKLTANIACRCSGKRKAAKEIRPSALAVLDRNRALQPVPKHRVTFPVASGVTVGCHQPKTLSRVMPGAWRACRIDGRVRMSVTGYQTKGTKRHGTLFL